MSPQKFHSKYRAEEAFNSHEEEAREEEEANDDYHEQIEEIVGGPGKLEQFEVAVPTVRPPPPGTASHHQQQQSVRYVDPHGNYISDQDIMQYAQKLRQQLLQNLITLLSSALQSSNSVV